MRVVLKRAWGRLPESLKLGRAYRRSARFLEASEAWSPGEWEHYRLDQLKAMLQFAGERVPHYRELFRRTGFDPRAMRSCGDLAVLPTVDKAELRARKEAYTATLPARVRCLELATGGTTGIPHSFPYPRALYNREYAFMFHLWSRVGYVPGEKLIILRARTQSEEQSVSFDPRWNARVLSVQHLNAENVRMFRDRMIEYGARYLLSYPSSANWYFGLLADAGLEPPAFRALLLASESVPAEQRRFLEEFGQTRVFTWYGHTERLVLAGECEHSSLYHEEPAYGYLELVNDAGEAILEPGRPGEMVGTSFDNRALPFIRFRTGDRGVWHEASCACGRPHRILARIEGRWGSEYLVAADGAEISVSTLNLHGDQYRRIRQFQYAQDVPGHATVRIVPAPGFTETERDRLLEGLQSVTGTRLTWSASVVDRIVPGESGKHQIVLQRVKKTSSAPAESRT